MSREFGDEHYYSKGFMHERVRQAAEVCWGSRSELTQTFGQLLDELAEVAYAISTAEAGDSTEAYPILETIERLPLIRRRVDALDAFVANYRDVAKRAVQEHIAKDEPTDG